MLKKSHKRNGNFKETKKEERKGFSSLEKGKGEIGIRENSLTGFTPLETIGKQKKAVMSLRGFTREPVHEPLTSFGFGTVQGFAPWRNPVKEEATAVKPWSFTLIELMVVVVIIGILASIAIPRYGKAVERSRLAEAVNILGAIRGAQIRFSQEGNNYATNISNLDMDYSTTNSTFFTFEVIGTGESNNSLNDELAEATRNTASVSGGYLAGYTVSIYENGNINVSSGGPQL